MGLLGSVIGAGASLLGGILGNKSNQAAGDANAALQREFAQNGVRWKVEDAKAAGIHPLYALGANTMSASPAYTGDTSLATGVSNMGQDIGRAVDQGRTQGERLSARMGALALERSSLENDLLRSQIAKLNQQPTPPLPSDSSEYLIDGQGSTHMAAGLVQPQPATPINAASDNPAREAGHVTDYGYARTDRGFTIVPSSDVKNRIEDAMIPEMQWSLRNLHILPPDQTPPLSQLPSSYDYWRWNPLRQEFTPARSFGQAWRNFRSR